MIIYCISRLEEVATMSQVTIAQQQRQEEWEAILNRMIISETERCVHQQLHRNFLERIDRAIISCQTSRLINHTQTLQSAIVKSRQRLTDTLQSSSVRSTQRFLCCSTRAKRIEIFIGLFREYSVTVHLYL